MRIQRIPAIDFLRGLAMILMALDHVRLYFGYENWYAQPTNLDTTTPALFFTRWITHFCAPIFVFLAGTSAFLYGNKQSTKKTLALFLFTRGLWLIFAELVIVNFAWTFDVTFSYIILQVIWAIGISMIVLSALVFLPTSVIAVIGFILVFGHNFLDSIKASGMVTRDILWYILHQEHILYVGKRVIDIHYPALPWIGLMALGYAAGTFYTASFDAEKRKRWLVWIGTGAISLFLLLRGLNVYGEPIEWFVQSSPIFTVMSFINTTKYPPSLQFLLMTIGPALILLALSEKLNQRITTPLVVFGRVSFFFYILHLYLIHVLAVLAIVYKGYDWHAYIMSAAGIRSGILINFGFGLDAVYVIWILVIVSLYPLCKWYQKYRENNPTQWWLSYL